MSFFSCIASLIDVIFNCNNYFQARLNDLKPPFLRPRSEAKKQFIAKKHTIAL